MSVCSAAEHRARRQRLFNSSHAVHDDGIDLKRSKKPRFMPICPLTVVQEVSPPIIPVVDLVAEEIARLTDRLDELRAKETVPMLLIVDIQKVVAAHFGMRLADILAHRRTAEVVRPRQIAMYLAKILTLKSYPELGRRFAGRDHTTVLHGVRKIEALRQSDAELNGHIEKLLTILKAA